MASQKTAHTISLNKMVPSSLPRTSGLMGHMRETRMSSIFAQNVKGTPSPDVPVNINWVGLEKLSGGLANLIYTVQGLPPSTASASSSLNSCLSYSINVIFLL